MTSPRLCLVTFAGLLVVGCGTQGVVDDDTGCPGGAVACVEGCCDVCRRHEDCGPGLGCCDEGQCRGACDPCGHTVCDEPPAATCLDGHTLRTFQASGTCYAGVCDYAASDTTCAQGCADGACYQDQGAACDAILCDRPPAATCVNASTLRSYASLGVCAAGTCAYGFVETPCAGGCEDRICDGCVDPTCQSMGFECGARANPCGGTLNCGTCPGGAVCGSDGRCLCADADQDGFEDAACGGNDCDDANRAVHPFQPESCDGLDNNCDGLVDEGVSLPAQVSAIAWVPPGFAGLDGGVLLTWDGAGAFYDAPSGKTTLVFSLQQLWDFFGTSGTQPPTTAIDAVVVLPVGTTLGMNWAGDSIAVTAGGTLFVCDGGAKTWTSMKVTDFFPTAEVDTLALFGTDHLFAGFGDFFYQYAYDPATLGYQWGAPTSVASLLCPAGSSNCPTSVDALGILAFSPTAYVLVNHDDSSQIAPIAVDGTGALVFAWSDFDLSTIACGL